MYVCVKDSPTIKPGKQFTFYGAYTMEKTGEATVVEAVKNEDEAINTAFRDALKKAATLTWEDTVVPWLVTLDRDLEISELEVLDCPQVRFRELLILEHLMIFPLVLYTATRIPAMSEVQWQTTAFANHRSGVKCFCKSILNHDDYLHSRFCLHAPFTDDAEKEPEVPLYVGTAQVFDLPQQLPA